MCVVWLLASRTRHRAAHTHNILIPKFLNIETYNRVKYRARKKKTLLWVVLLNANNN